MKEIFISYSHKDEDWKNRLLTHLRVLEKEGYCILWDDRKIQPGDDWYPEIENAFNRVSIAVMLITADFLTSNFIRKKEMPRLIERRKNEGLRIIPIIVKPCPWQSVKWLSSIQVMPKDGVPLMKGSNYEIEVKLASIAEQIYQLTLNASDYIDNEIPHKNLVYDIKHNLRSKRNYIRRKLLEDKILNALCGTGPIIFLHGISGVGKTYLAEAVLHKILTKGVFTHIIFIKPSEDLNLNNFLDVIIDVFEATTLRQLDISKKIKIVKNLLRKSKAIIIIDSYEKVRKNKEIKDFIINLPHPSKLLLTSTIYEELEGMKYIPVNKIKKDNIEEFTKKMAEYLAADMQLLQSIDWQEFYNISDGMPHIISKILGLAVRRGYTLDGAIKIIRNTNIEMSFEDRILNYMWENEMSDKGHLITQSLSIIQCRLSLENLVAITKMSPKDCEKILHDLFEINFIDIYPNEHQYDLHDIIFYYVGSRPEVQSNSDLMGNLKKRNYNYCNTFLKEKGGENNWEGFRNIQNQLDYIWTTCQTAYKEKQFYYIIEYWRYLDNFLFYYGYYEKRVDLGKWAKEAANNTKDIISYPWILLSITDTEWYLYGNYKKTLETLGKALHLFQTNKDKRGEGFSFYHIGRIHRQVKDFQNAKTHLYKALDIAKSIDDVQLLAFCLNNIGNLEISLKNPKKATDYFTKSLHIWEKLKDFAMIGVCYRNLLKSYRDQGNLKSAEELYKKGLLLFNELGISMEIGEIKYEMAKLYFKINKKEEAEEILNEAEEIFKKAHAKTFLNMIDEVKSGIS